MATTDHAAPLLFTDADASAAVDRMVAAYAALTGVELAVGDPERIVFQAVAAEIARGEVTIGAAASQGLLAFACGEALDAVVGMYGVERLSGETDASLRERARLSLATLGAAGTPESWRAHALAAHPDVAVVVAYAPAGGGGLVRVVVAGVDGADLSDEAVAAVEARLLSDDVRQLCTTVEVVRPTPIFVDLDVVYYVRAAYRSETARIEAEVAAAAEAYAVEVGARPGTDLVRDQIVGAIMGVRGVRRVEVVAPAERVVSDDEVVRIVNVSTRLGAGDDGVRYGPVPAVVD